MLIFPEIGFIIVGQTTKTLLLYTLPCFTETQGVLLQTQVIKTSLSAFLLVYHGTHIKLQFMTGFFSAILALSYDLVKCQLTELE